jgi:hypothetical protein
VPNAGRFASLPAMRLHPPSRAPLDVAAAERLDADFRAEIEGLPLSAALVRYHARMDGLLAAAHAGAPLACGPGCDTCCHQPLLVSFLELGAIFFSDEARFGSPAFREVLRAAVRALGDWKRDAGASGAVGVAQRQFAAHGACVLLGAEGRCTAYEVRPFLCRNAVSGTRCSWSDLSSYGFGDLAALARRLRHRMFEHAGLGRFDRDGVKLGTAAFYLPEGLAWFADRAPRDALRPLFRP